MAARNLGRDYYRKQAETHIESLALKISNLQKEIKDRTGGLLDERDRMIQHRLWLQNELDNVGAGWMISTELPNVARRFCVNSSALPQRIARRLADVRRGRVVQPSRADRPPAEHGT